MNCERVRKFRLNSELCSMSHYIKVALALKFNCSLLIQKKNACTLEINIMNIWFSYMTCAYIDLEFDL